MTTTCVAIVIIYRRNRKFCDDFLKTNMEGEDIQELDIKGIIGFDGKLWSIINHKQKLCRLF